MSDTIEEIVEEWRQEALKETYVPRLRVMPGRFFHNTERDTAILKLAARVDALEKRIEDLEKKRDTVD